MRLKKLVISGFKSFPSRTRIHFVPGVSAIVGPNGCGKSNIADAIRWVLGEQSPGRIRARHMDDLIYRGSDGRKAAFAEVSLLLENDAGMAPPELAELPEIEVKRMIYRSGDTRYLLNGKNCRLKDIHYLFMDTGAGARAYSIIDQGQIGRYVEMGGDERRHMVEEAAGVSRFKARRDDARRRMARAEENLERLDDLILELEKQKRSLARQAAKARRFRKLRRKREELEVALFKKRWDACLSALGGLREMYVKEAVHITALKASRAAEDMRLNMAELDEAEAAEGVMKAVSLFDHVEKRLNAFKQEHEEGERQRISAETRIEEFRERVRDAEKRVGEVRERRKEVSSGIEDLEKGYAEINREISVAGQEVSVLRVHVKELREEVEDIKGRVVSAASELARCRSEKKGLEDRMARLESRSRRGREELERLDIRVGEMEREKGDLEERAGVMKEELGAMEKGEQALLSEIAGLSAALEKLGRKRSGVEAERVRVSTRLSALVEVERKGVGVPGEVRKILNGREDVCGLLTDFIEVDPGYERAFEALLGHFINALIIPGGHEGLLAFTKLHEGEGLSVIPARCSGDCAGDSRVPPVKERQTPCSRFVCPDMTGPGEGLSGRIRVSVVIEDALTFLAQVSLCQDMEAALSFFPNTPDGCRPVNQVVTEQGDLLAWWGGVVMGRSRKKGVGGVLERANEIKRLGLELESHETRVGELLFKEKGIDERLRGLKENLKGLFGRKKDKEKSYEGLVKRLAAVKPELEGLQSRRSLMEYEVAELEREREELKRALTAASSALESAEAGERGVKALLLDRQDHLKRQEKVLGAGRGKLNRLKTDAAVCKSSLEDHRRELERIEKALKGLEEDISSREVMEKELLLRLEEAVSVVGLAAAKVEAQEVALKMARNLAGERKKAGDRARERVVSVKERISTLGVRMRQHEKEAHRLELEISKLEKDARFLSRGLFERYRKDIREVSLSPDLEAAFDEERVIKEIEGLSGAIEKTGPVNLAAEGEFDEVAGRLSFLGEQKADLLASISDLREAIDRLGNQSSRRFSKALGEINESLARVFPLLFEGGSARLELERNREVAAEEDEGQDAAEREAGVDFLIQLPGKKIQNLNLLSGGEKTMAAIALIFAMYFIKPSPFCLLDEVDAPLDEANTVRFSRLIEEVAEISQVILITHNHVVMEMADTLYGVTMEKKGVSRLVAVNLNRAEGAA